jgi:predicted MFS family arabinose efflux permease
LPACDIKSAMNDKEITSAQSSGKLLTRDFVLVFFAFFAFIAANHALIPTLPIYLTQVGSNERQVGVLVGITGMAALVSRFLVGGALTRYSEKRIMVIGSLLFALTFPAAILFSRFWPLFAVRVFQGIALACFHTAALAYVINIVPHVYRAQGIAYFMLAPNIAMSLVAPSGMFLINQYGFTIFFLSCMGLSLCSFFLSWKKVRSREMAVTSEESTGNAFLPEWRIFVPAIVNFLMIFAYGGLTAFIPLYALERGITNPGHFFTATSVVMIAGRVLGGKILDTCNKEKMILSFIFISIAALVILSFSKNLTMFILVGMLWGIGAAFLTPVCMSYAFEYAGTSSGAAVGTYQASMDLGLALGPVIAGLIIPFTGYPIMFLCLAFICFINMGYFQFYVRRRHNNTVITH